jgi:hypothetical protein
MEMLLLLDFLPEILLLLVMLLCRLVSTMSLLLPVLVW